MTSPPRIEVLTDHHDRESFACGVQELDDYFRRRARQDRDRFVAAVFVLLGDQPDTIAGFYTLSSLGVALADLPAEAAKKLPKYPVVPSTLIGRLAVDERHRGRGLGELLLMDALARSLEQAYEIASAAIIVDAKDDAARSFYEHFGFACFPDRRYRLFLPMKTVAKMFAP